MKRKNIYCLVFGMMLLLVGSFSACSAEAPTSSSDVKISETVGMANPFVDFASVEEASEFAGFDFRVPVLHGDMYGQKEYPDSWIQAIEGDLIQVCYLWDDEQILFRKGRGEADISGDYNEYPDVLKLMMTDFKNAANSDCEVTLKGKDGLYNLAVWSYDGYAYSISSTVGFIADWYSDKIEEIMTQ